MRVISLLASATEIIAALGCLDQLVGRSHECDYPPEVMQLPLVSHIQIDTNTSSAQIDAQIKTLARTHNTVHQTALKALSIYAIDVQQLQQLKPDLIFTQTQCEVCAVSQHDVEEALQEYIGRKPRIISLAPYRLQDVWEDIQRVGNALNKTQPAQYLIADYQQRLNILKEHTDRLIQQRGEKKPRIVVLEWLDPLMAAGNWTPELIDAAGGENLLGKIGEHSPWLQWEDLQVADPDVIILSPCGFTLERTLQDLPLLQQQTAWHMLRAVQQGQVYAIDGNFYLNRSGPRLVESAELLARSIWGKRILPTPPPENSWQRIQG